MAVLFSNSKYSKFVPWKHRFTSKCAYKLPYIFVSFFTVIKMKVPPEHDITDSAVFVMHSQY